MTTAQFSAPEPLQVGIGAGLGALARYLMTATLLFSAPFSGVTSEFLIALTINAIGCFAMGWWKPGPFLGTGFLGGFTTFSAVMGAATQTTFIAALSFIVISFVVCVGTWLLGDALSAKGSA